ncbi:MurR/RpiR family transcriptional regulator [Spiractinospora alimapuensis]|uniref:MurR/RpiR family transcriptional regulator n=1 Tax=Spiractinospora alimapuensis TaxID=2820884 RepID=UPI001F3AF7DC|nr:MurR/RpiR family transcriptional regulator [Spiractinospora alimapuensis]QVQ53991.1 MurR/RpiR family transcriptional regulator [Spiractinospora alimapuensis]
MATIDPSPDDTTPDTSAPTRAAPSTVVRIRALIPSLAPAERRVARAVVDNPDHVTTCSITQLAKECGTSEATIIRFCRTIDFSGYRDLRITLATESGQARSAGQEHRDIGGDINPDDTLLTVVEKIAYTDARAVEETGAQLDIEELRRVILALSGARRIDIYGVGASAFVAADFQQKLHRIGVTSFAWSDSHTMRTSAAVLEDTDMAIGVSHSGATTDTIAALAQARARGATTVAITNFPRSAITETADHCLTTAARETTFRSGATASRLAQLTVVDCVFVGLAQLRYSDSRAALESTFEAVKGLRIDRGEQQRRARSRDD